ncbi:YqgE/AlgH family protein [Vicingus serpentipes]|uniref:YqgE/AlgH family protein n=1 Tax=Vicingus serpentipes TaxID=1926625 RepID=A0A5C6RVH4_9FLAO|nr:YqgE/AlgH family protein [Vicingus serpentipes]TXB65889.1 YqgE/AlgH family protein [Vicingus serpentipes]
MDINPFDYTISSLNKLKLKKGRLLLAEPFMVDPYFKRSVVLLTEYNKENCFGFILNQSLELTVNDVIADFPKFEAPVFMGGPVSPDNLFYIHSQGKYIQGSQKITDNLWWTGNFDQLKFMIQNNEIFPHEVKFFLGYSGWDYLQLNNEVKHESWIITDANDLTIKDLNNKQLWQTTLKKMGNKHALLSNFPVDPSLN